MRGFFWLQDTKMEKCRNIYITLQIRLVFLHYFFRIILRPLTYMRIVKEIMTLVLTRFMVVNFFVLIKFMDIFQYEQNI